MADQMTGEPSALSRALAEPTVHVRRGWITGLSLASLGMWMASLTPLQVLIPIQLQDITPQHKIARAGVGVRARRHRVRPRHPAGRRPVRPHHAPVRARLAARPAAPLDAEHGAARGGIAGRAGPAGDAWPAWPLLWVLFSAFQNGEYASLSAAIPDHVPVRQRATVAGWVGMPQALGLVLGTVLVVDVFTKLISGYLTRWPCCWSC